MKGRQPYVLPSIIIIVEVTTQGISHKNKTITGVAIIRFNLSFYAFIIQLVL